MTDDQIIEAAIQGHASARDAIRWAMKQVRMQANTHQPPSVSEINTHKPDAVVRQLVEALEFCRFSLEPYDDIKPRDWKSDRENLRRAHHQAQKALAAAKAHGIGSSE